jgi:hypothetical protein
VSDLVVGAFVTHAKLPDLGNGEILATEGGTLRVRFASGERAFSTELVAKHLTVTQEGPPPKAAAKAASRKRAAKAAGAKAAAPKAAKTASK